MSEIIAAALKVAVTGANGFVGSAITMQLVAAGATVKALHGPGPAAEFQHKYCTVLRGDISDESILHELLDSTDVVIHVAGPPSVAASFERPADAVRIHVAGTASLLQASVRCGVRRVVYISSAEVYGCPETDFVREDHPLRPRSPYAAAKIGAEKLLEVYGLAFGMETLILRPFSVYGPGASPASVVSRVVALARQNAPMVLNELRPVRDFCFVGDVARAAVIGCTASCAQAVFNIGTMQPTSILDLAQMALAVADSRERTLESSETDRPFQSQIMRLVSDNRHAREALQWQPIWSLEDGLRCMLRDPKQ
ncbi:MAG: NAD-dependent epimerase/dehydratase family protein [Acidobacteriota bacterium]|nr:NAD-dependent epimerase/dehydratase family protein [Acidobacteriota bacterium]